MKRAPRVLGHPIHPPLTHFPLALLAIAPLLDATALLLDDPFWWSAGFWILAGGLAFAVPAAFAGVVDYLAIPPQTRAGNLASRHMTLMLTATLLATVNLILRGGTAQPEGTTVWAVPAVSVFTTLLLLIGGWYGAQLVYGHGVGVDLPTETQTHSRDG